MPMRKEKVSRRMGSLTGSNQMGPQRQVAVEEGRRDDRDRVPEEAAEHESPEGGGQPAPEEHLDHLADAGLHVLVLEDHDRAGDRHDEAVARVGKHHAEEDVIEEGHDGRRVDLVPAGEAVALDDRFDRGGEGVVLEHDRHVLVGAGSR